MRGQHYAILRERRHLRRRRVGSGRRTIVWGLDLTGKEDSNRRSSDILGVIDHGTRRLLGLTPMAAPSSWTVLGHLCLLIGRFGKPRAVRTDNGAIFTARCFGAGLALMGIRHQRSAVGCPWQNGRIERLLGTLKSKLDHWSVANRQELSRALDLFLIWYNAVRPHQALDGRTPLEAWHGIDPFARPPRGVTGFSAWDGLLTGVLIRR